MSCIQIIFELKVSSESSLLQEIITITKSIELYHDMILLPRYDIECVYYSVL